MEFQDQIYIIAGGFGAIALVLLILICTLFSKISKLQRLSRKDDFSRSGGRDVLETRGFSEYKGPTIGPQRFEVQSPTSPSHSGLSRQHSGAGYSGYQPQEGPPVPKAPLQSSSIAYNSSHAHANVYGKSYDNSAYEKEQRDVTAGGVRVLPSATSMDHQHRRNNYENY